jgi:hypothetical protein
MNLLFPHMRLPWLSILLLPALACASGAKTSTGRTERETDSVIGQSQLPGAHGVKAAMDAQDSARARAAAVDSVAETE